MTNLNELLNELNHAQQLLANVYHYARNTKNDTLESLMSDADNCIYEAMNALRRENEA